MANNDLFFEPWEGKDYTKGIKLENGEIKLCDKENEGPKIMVLGLEHYCISDQKPTERNAAQQDLIKIFQNNSQQPNSTIIKMALKSAIQKPAIQTLQKELPCQIHTGNNKDCAHLFICRQFTKLVIQDALDYAVNPKLGWPEPSSHKIFREAFFGKQNKVEDWHKVAFFNFFQIGMPYTVSRQNQKFRKNAEIDSSEKQRGVSALIEVLKDKLKDKKPDIIFAWGTAIWEAIKNKQKELNNVKIYVRTTTKNEIPNMHIKEYPIRKEKAKKDFDIPFTILDLKNDEGEVEHSCLLVFMDHPASWHYVKDTPKPFEYFIKCILKYWRVFIRWNHKEIFWRNRKVDLPITCTFDKNFKWINSMYLPILPDD